MKRFFCLCCIVCGFAACAGNPPAWWNPHNRYGSVEVDKQPASSVVLREPVVQEETIDPMPDRSYEEEVITPLSDEENKNDMDSSPEQNGEDFSLPPPSVLSAS